MCVKFGMRLQFCVIMKSKQARNHQFHYLTGKYEMFSASVAAKFSTHAKIKYTEL